MDTVYVVEMVCKHKDNLIWIYATLDKAIKHVESIIHNGSGRQVLTRDTVTNPRYSCEISPSHGSSKYRITERNIRR